MTPSVRRILGTAGASGVASLALLYATTGVAAAHVGVSGTSTAAGSSTVLTFSSGHGCSGSPTNRFAIQIPSGINSATPTQLAGWHVEKVMQNLDTPITGSHGNQITQRVDQIVYTAQEPLPDGVRVAFEISVQLPAEAADAPLYFPTIQQCVEGSNDWIQIPSAGQNPDDLESPAPALQVTAATGNGAHGASGNDAHGTTTAAGDQQQPTAAAPAPSNSATALSIVALIVGIVGVALGGGALLKIRRKA